MENQGIARKWRPGSFEDLVGQTHVVQTLKNAVTMGRLAPAFLFSGARGVGKTSVARIFAKLLRCPNVKNGEPCNRCAECDLITQGRSVDVVEIDGASNNGVEAVRELRESVAYGAASGKYKIYIIDEVHMLSTSAFNALLKTLEEPPPHVLFLFATTEVHKIPLTILSRCLRFEFRRLTTSQIMHRLEQVLQDEKVKVSEEGLRVIASNSDGALRDALSLLDQVISFVGSAKFERELSVEDVTQALGLSQNSVSRAVLLAVAENDTPKILKLIDEIVFAGVDLKQFCHQTLEEIRRLYLLALVKEPHTQTPEQMDISKSHLDELLVIAEKVTVVRIERMAQILSKVMSQLNWAGLPRFALEMAFVRMTQLGDLERIEAIVKSDQSTIADTSPARTAPPEPASMTNQPQPVSSRPGELSWQSVIEMVMKKKPLLGSLLSHANFRIEEKGSTKHVHLAFEPESFFEKQANDSKYKLEIQAQLVAIFGEGTQVEISNELAQTNSSLEKVKKTHEDTLKKEALAHPVVQNFKDMLNAEVVGVNVHDADKG